MNEAELAAGNQLPFPLIDPAFIHAIQGETKEVLGWLRKSVDAGFYDLSSSVFDKLRNEPEFQQIKAEVDKVVTEMRRQVGEMEQEWEQN